MYVNTCQGVLREDEKIINITLNIFCINTFSDIDHNGVLTFNEILKLVTELNIYMPKASVRAIFDKVDLDKSGQLDIDEFMDFVKLLRER